MQKFLAQPQIALLMSGQVAFIVPFKALWLLSNCNSDPATLRIFLVNLTDHNYTYPLKYTHKRNIYAAALGHTHTHSRSNVHTCEAALCGLCCFWPAALSLLNMYEGKRQN